MLVMHSVRELAAATVRSGSVDEIAAMLAAVRDIEAEPETGEEVAEGF